MLTKNLKKNWKGSYKDTTQNSIGNDLLVCKKNQNWCCEEGHKNSRKRLKFWY